MRPRDAFLLAMAAVFLTGACSRLTFVKPSAKRKGAEQVAPEYTFTETKAAKQRTAVRNRVVKAEQRIREGQLDAAEAEIESALKIDPKSPEAHTVLAMIADLRGRPTEAGGYYAKAAELAPDRAATLNNYGAWLCANGRAAESLGWFERALADPRARQAADVVANVGACALKAGQLARVEPSLRAALEIDPENAVALAAMADYQFRQGRYFEARAFSERRLAAAPATREVLQLASQIETKLGDTAAAARYVQRSRTEFPQMRTAQPGENTP